MEVHKIFNQLSCHLIKDLPNTGGTFLPLNTSVFINTRYIRKILYLVLYIRGMNLEPPKTSIANSNAVPPECRSSRKAVSTSNCIVKLIITSYIPYLVLMYRAKYLLLMCNSKCHFHVQKIPGI